MDQTYRDATTRMEELGVMDEYIGRQTAYLGHPEREEQNLNEAYEAGRAAGNEKSIDDIADGIA